MDSKEAETNEKAIAGGGGGVRENRRRDYILSAPFILYLVSRLWDK